MDYKVVLDTNVLISAIVFGGKPRYILEAIIRGRMGLAVSESILEEVKAVLVGRKFQYPWQIVHTVLTELGNISEFIDPQVTVNKITKDPDDNRMLECAVESGADFIVSGDSHLLELGSFKGIRFKGIRIMNPAALINELRL